MALSCILTCEHAGNDVPAPYEHLFKGEEEVLYSHKAIDFGAFRLAKHLAEKLQLPLFSTSCSRLLVEPNRSLDSGELFSKYSKALSEQEKQKVLAQYYFPHRQQVEANVQSEISKGNHVLHLAVHTFTPAQEGEVRQADIGILFDPDRTLESSFAAQLEEALRSLNPSRKVLFNAPYAGVEDGFPTYLRTRFTDDQYAGFELEINQKFFLQGEPEVWEQVVDEMTEAVKSLLLPKG
ncbi:MULTISPECIES: N-formylglutamate amidohydrolase [Rufibacter]|uniref:Putative N-formylglutamate amidohydrolase n=1 Tax=Rufibacter quisquiliarum TaxID=1549639 RepID=A0A839GHU2_9BACT|nr:MULTISPECIES: N-formylglutamate amidohydrolase [Rufibacter]MBA9077223.1 putative N-formylglutamate amidohydrolase [Rufibacter quisquiliarum]